MLFSLFCTKDPSWSCRDCPHHLHVPCPAGVLSISLRENVSQAWPSICLCHWHHRELQQSGGGRTQPARGGTRWLLIGPAMGLGTLQPLLLASSLIQGLPMSLHSPPPMATHSPRFPASHELAGALRCDPLCHLPVVLFIEHHCPSTGLCFQAPGFQSALWEADRGWAGPGEASLPHSASSLPRAWLLEQELGTQMVIAAINYACI